MHQFTCIILGSVDLTLFKLQCKALCTSLHVSYWGVLASLCCASFSAKLEALCTSLHVSYWGVLASLCLSFSAKLCAPHVSYWGVLASLCLSFSAKLCAPVYMYHIGECWPQFDFTLFKLQCKALCTSLHVSYWGVLASLCLSFSAKLCAPVYMYHIGECWPHFV